MNQSNSSVERTWHAPETDDILWAEWDDEFIAFHRPSGKTHLLNAASEALLTRILSEPKTSRDIVRELTCESDRTVGDGLVAGIDDLLMRLEELGLVVRS